MKEKMGAERVRKNGGIRVAECTLCEQLNEQRVKV